MFLGLRTHLFWHQPFLTTHIQSVCYCSFPHVHTCSCTTQRCQPSSISICFCIFKRKPWDLHIFFVSFPFFGNTNTSKCWTCASISSSSSHHTCLNMKKRSEGHQAVTIIPFNLIFPSNLPISSATITGGSIKTKCVNLISSSYRGMVCQRVPVVSLVLCFQQTPYLEALCFRVSCPSGPF